MTGVATISELNREVQFAEPDPTDFGRHPATGPRTTPAIAAISVLVVDDHILLADGVVRALRLENYDANTVHPTSLTVIVDAAVQLRPTVTLLGLDFGNLEFSGLDLIRPLTELGTAVVVLTGWQDRLLTAASLELGALGVVCKSEPFASVIRAVVLAASGAAALGALERDELGRELRERRNAHARHLAPFHELSLRERQVLSALVEGRSANTIAETSFVSISTVRSQIRSVLQKLNVNSQLEAVAAATRCGWTADSVFPLVRYSSTLTL